jgi:hypothetical protein
VLLVDGEVARMPEDLPRRRVDDGRARADLAQDLQEAELTSGVDLEVEAWARHRLDVAHLTGQVEDHLGRRRGVPDGDRVVDRRLDDVDPTGGALEVGAITAVGGHERVDDRHLGAGRRERQREVRPDETQPARDQAPTTGKEREERLVQSRSAYRGSSRAPGDDARRIRVAERASPCVVSHTASTSSSTAERSSTGSPGSIAARYSSSALTGDRSGARRASSSSTAYQ